MLIFSSSVFSDENEEQKAEELVEYKAKLEAELAEVQAQMKKYMEELGL